MRYTESHEWISLDGNIGTVGITAYAQKELGNIVYIELPKIGQIIKAGEEACVLESTKAAVDIYSPVSGKIIALNPAFLESSSEQTRWLFQIELFQVSELDRLLSLSQYEDFYKNY